MIRCNCNIKYFVKHFALPKRRWFYVLLTILLIAYLCYHSDSTEDDASEIPMVSESDILRKSHEETSKNFTMPWPFPLTCDYEAVISDETILSPSLVDSDLVEGHRIKEGGEYAPYHCKPKFSVAIIIPYRDRVTRTEQLRGFLIYMHIFLRPQRIHYRIYVVEQIDTQPYSRPKLMNIGAQAAMKDGYPCLVFHDMDLLPLRSANLYSCSKCSRRMDPDHKLFSYSCLRRQFVPARHTGSAIAIRSEQFKTINGFSIKYGDSDDLQSRLAKYKLDVCKFDSKFNQYHRLEDVGIASEFKREMKKVQTIKEIVADGLSSLQYSKIATVLHPIFTHIMVDLAYISSLSID